MDTETLVQLGLNNSEINVYFALLKMDTSSVGPIIKKAKVADSKIYRILDSLKEKGLVSYILKNNVKHYQANDPKNILKIINNKEEKLTRLKEDLIKRIIPEIEAKRKENENRKEAFIYESFKGLKSAFNLILDSLEKGEEYLVFSLGEELMEKRVKNLLLQFHKLRVNKGINGRIILSKKFQDIYKKEYSSKKMESKFTDDSLPIGTFIFKDHVMQIIWDDEPIVFITRSKKNYQYYKNFFEDVWKKS
jgi:HTH-type transcriptional regulator, sugar sensing transcriptional regulator